MRQPGLDRSTLVVAGVATIGLIMAALDTTIVNVALDTLSSDLHAPLGTIQWVSTAYLLSLAAVIPLGLGATFMWAAVMALLAVAPALVLLRAKRARRRAQTPSAAKPDRVGQAFPRSSSA